MSKAFKDDTFFDDPSAFGMPTFDEFKRNRKKYMGSDDDILATADKGSTMLKDVRRHVYELEGYRCKSLEEVERIASQQGIPLRELDYRPEMIQAGAGRYDIIVKFVSKRMRDKRDQWDK